MRLSVLVISALLVCSSCSVAKKDRVSRVIVRSDFNELDKDRVPGTVDDVWVEEMHDTIDVPGQIDARGVYYREGHNSVVEVRQGRFQKVEYPDDRVGVK